MPVKINVVPRLRSLESVRDRVIGMKVPRSPMAPLSSPHFERKTKLVFTFCKITLNEKRVVEVVWVVSWVEIGIEGFWFAMEYKFRCEIHSLVVNCVVGVTLTGVSAK